MSNKKITATDTDILNETSKVQDLIDSAPASSAALTRTLREDATFRTYFFNLSWMAYWLVFAMTVTMYGLQYMLGSLRSPVYAIGVLVFFVGFPYVMDVLAVYSFRFFLGILRLFSRGNAMYNYTPDDIANP